MLGRAEAATPFDPQRPGRCSAETWASVLRDVSRWTPPASGTLWVVAPHPDDESLGAGGLIASRLAAGGAVEVLTLTHGEAAQGAPDVWLGRRRLRELIAALARLGLSSDHLTPLGYPDGRVGEHEHDLLSDIERRVQPGDLVVAPYGEDGHPDHEAAGRACRRVAEMRGLVYREYPIWAWHRLTSAQLLGLRPERLDLSPSIRATKRAAIDVYESQLHATSGAAPIVPDHVRRYFDHDFELYLP